MRRLVRWATAVMAMTTPAWTPAQPTRGNASDPRREVAAPGTPVASDDVRIRGLFAQWDSTTTPGCAVGIVREGRLVLKHGFGMADLAAGARITPATVFGIASLSKQFTAAGIALLAEEGRVDLDADVRTYLPELPVYERPIRVRDLVYHTSGLRDYLSMVSLAGGNAEDRIAATVALTLVARQRGLNNTPGAAHLYSNTNYFLLAQIIARVSQQPFADVMTERLFAPLEMFNTRFARDGDFVAGQAESYRHGEGGRREQVALPGMLSGDGGAYTTLEDLARWEANFTAPRVGREPRRLVATLRTNGQFTDGRPVGYGWGTQFSTYRGLATEGHGGTWGGFRAYTLRFPTERFTAITLCNQLEISPFQLTRRLADIFLASKLAPETEPPPPPVTPPTAGSAPAAASVPPDVRARYAGRYYSEELGAEYRIESSGDGLALRVAFANPVPVRLAHADTLTTAARTMTVRRDDRGCVIGLSLNSGRVRGVLLDRVGAPSCQ